MSTVPKTQFSGPDLCKMSAHEVVAFLKAKKVSPAELLDACFARIEAVEPQVNAMPTICKDRAYAALSAVEGASMLAGVPMGIKDLTEVEGVRTTMGTHSTLPIKNRPTGHPTGSERRHRRRT